MTDVRGIGMTSQRTRLRLIERLKADGIGDERVLQAMTDTPRHLFVDEALAHRAYEDTALPIGFNQTLSSHQATVTPYAVGACSMSKAPATGGAVLVATKNR